MSTSCATMPGTAVNSAPDKKALKGKLPPVSPASTNRTMPQTMRPDTMSVSSTAYSAGRLCFTLRHSSPDTRP